MTTAPAARQPAAGETAARTLPGTAPAGDDLAFATIGELGALLRAREISPVELTRYFLDRLDRVARPLNAVVTVTGDVALREAALAEAEIARGVDRGPLHGIPYGAKDIIATAGIATTWGAAPFAGQVPGDDATVIRRLRDAGAVLAAKLATVEIAGGMGYDNPDASLTGPAGNPWDPRTWTSGSSSGPAAAVAAGALPFAIGSDTSGSILLPAAWTGTAGLRATYGLVSRRGAMTLCWTLDRLGPMCRTARDCGLVLEAIAGPDAGDPASLPGPVPGSATGPYRYRRPAPRAGGFRIGVVAGAADGAEPEVAANYERSLRYLSEIGTLTEVTLPDFPYTEVQEIISAAEAYAAFDEFIARGGTRELTARQAKAHRLAGALLPAHDYIRAQRIRRQIAVAFDALASQFDAIVAPTIGTTASGRHDDFEYMLPGAFARPLNYAGVLAGSPTVSVPNGLGRGGLPTAIALAGARLAENAVLDAASALQDRSGVPDIRGSREQDQREQGSREPGSRGQGTAA
jgi:aspartyl-tRNA(Asn)/glutamyl-tRNA(Gln) amidotransferase subunit A